MGGFVTIERDIFVNPKMRGKDDIFAAIWLVAHAAWKPVCVRVGREAFDLERGQCAYAVRFLGEAWGCGKSSAHARLSYFEKIGFCRTESRTGATIITLCNYDKYQSSPDDARTDDRTEPGRCPDGARTNKKELKPVNKGKKEEGLLVIDADAPSDRDTHSRVVVPLRPSKPETSQAFARFWEAYPRRVARKAAEQAFAKAIKTTDPEVVIAGAVRYAAQRRGQDQTFTAHPSTWLNAGRWADEPEPRSGGGGILDTWLEMGSERGSENG